MNVALYRLEAKVFNRKSGPSAVAAAAYRAGACLKNEVTGETHDYRRRGRRPPESAPRRGEQIVSAVGILAPAGAPSWATDRAALWNAVERAEKRSDAQTAREVQVSLPVELSRDQQLALVRKFAQANFVDQGMVADCCFHALDTHNPHAHIMLTMREIGPDGFSKKQRAWNNRGLLREWRKYWETEVNAALADAGIEARVDCRSRAAQGLPGAPQPKVGPTAAAIEREQAAAAPESAPAGGWEIAPLPAVLAVTGGVSDRGNELRRHLGLPSAKAIRDKIRQALDAGKRKLAAAMAYLSETKRLAREFRAEWTAAETKFVDTLALMDDRQAAEQIRVKWTSHRDHLMPAAGEMLATEQDEGVSGWDAMVDECETWQNTLTDDERQALEAAVQSRVVQESGEPGTVVEDEDRIPATPRPGSKPPPWEPPEPGP